MIPQYSMLNKHVINIDQDKFKLTTKNLKNDMDMEFYRNFLFEYS